MRAPSRTPAPKRYRSAPAGSLSSPGSRAMDGASNTRSMSSTLMTQDDFLRGDISSANYDTVAQTRGTNDMECRDGAPSGPIDITEGSPSSAGQSSGFLNR